MTGSSHASFALSSSRGRRPAGWSVATLAVAAVLAAAPLAVQAQGFFPSEPPAEFFVEDFEDAFGFGANWTSEGITNPTLGDWASSNVGCAGSGHWGAQALRDIASDASGAPGAYLVNTSIPEGPSFSGFDWASFRLEFDFSVSSSASRVGFVWASSEDTLGAGNGRDDAYVVMIENAQTAAGAAAGGRARWRLYKRTGDFTQQVATDLVQLPAAAGSTVLQNGCYRLRLEWFCGNLQVSIRRFVYDSGCPTGCTSGCNPPSGAPCTLTGDPDLCWCPIVRWTDPMPLDAGGSGIFSGGTGAPQATYVDNFSASTWGLGCTQVCTAWTAYSESWAAAGNARDDLRFKFLFEGGLIDQRYGLDDIGLGRVDADVLEPALEPGQVDGFCNGWRVLVDLPDWSATMGANEDDMRRFLEPISTAVSYDDGGDIYGVSDPSGLFTNTFDNDPASASYNPIPLVASGTTPIASALMDAYTWYVNTVSLGGAWGDDPLAACRNWYVVLITDGEESCVRRADGTRWLDYACEPGQAGAPAGSGTGFADPTSTSGLALDPVQVHVVGFSAGASAAGRPDIACVADNTDGNYYAAQNASDLASTLYDVINEMVEEDRAFLPISVSPPPSQLGASASGDFLVLVPQFIPKNNSSIWDGHLYAFRVNPDNPLVPVIAAPDPDAGMIDTGQAAWDAKVTLDTQLHGGSPARYTYTPRYVGTAWTRVALETIPGDATLAAEFKTLLDHTGGVTDTEVQEIVDFVRFLDASVREPYPIGDIFHASPAIVSPPNNFAYYFNNVHDYFTDFMQPNQYRRRVGVVGANDGLLHAFDVGAFDRNETDYNDAFDLGTGRELFAVLPEGVMYRIYNMVYGTEQQYLVDGGTATADVFITPPGGSGPEWRTLTMTALQQGGRSYLALDVTHPDPPGTIGPSMPVDALCLDGTNPSCTGVYPRMAFEFTDTSDEDANCPGGLVGDQCAPYWDLGWTWSPPAIARVKRDNSSAPGDPDDLFVAFFGGGWDDQNYNTTAYSALTGNFFYGVNVDTGEIVYKATMAGSMIPGTAVTLDADSDGFVDRVYFGDTTGGLWRLDVTTPALFAGSPARVTNWSLVKLYQFPADQEFFTRPVTVPATFSGGSFTWALALGSGDRANVTMEDGVENRFYFVLDPLDLASPPTLPLGEADLHPILVDPPDPVVAAGTSYLNPPTTYGWFIHLRVDEKVNADAIVAGEQVQFPTFLPTTTTVVPPDPVDPDEPPRCAAVGEGRLYAVWYNNANPTDPSGDRGPDLGAGLIVGGTPYTIGGRTVAQYTTWEGRMEEREIAVEREHVVTNWRQD